MTVIQIRLMGGFAATTGAGEAGPWRHKRATDLVKMLALAPGHRLHREQILDALWPELTIEAGGANLRKAVHYARRSLGEDAIGTEGEIVALRGATTDVEDLETSVNAASDHSSLVSAAAQYRGELLPEDRYESWTDDARRRVEAIALKVLRGAKLWNRVLEVDPLDEEAHRALMRASLDAGDRRGAIRQFDQLRERFRVDLGLGPSRESVTLYEEALAIEGHDPPSTAERARMHIAWGLVHLQRRDVDQAHKNAEEARALAVDAGLGREVGEASALLGMIAHARGVWREAFKEEFASSLRSPKLAPFIFDAHLCLAEFSLYGDQTYEETTRLATDLLEQATRVSSAHGEALATLMLGEGELLCGDLERAATSLERAIDLHERAASPSGQTLATVRLAETEIARGRKWQAKRLLTRASKLAPKTDLAPHLVVRVAGVTLDAAESPDVAGAERSLAERDVCDPCSMGFRVSAASAAARSGDLDRARRHLADAERVAGMWQGGPWLAAVWEARGVLRQAEGEPGQAAALFREAAHLFAQSSRLRDEKRCREAAAAAAG